MAEGDYEQRRRRHLDEVRVGLPRAARSLRWSADRLQEERDRRLRLLLGTAAVESEFFRERLRGFELEHFTESDLPALPVMTKSNLMESFDSVVTDDQLSLRALNDHLGSPAGGAYFLDEYHVVCTSGSSGMRGVYPYSWKEWTTFVLIQSRLELLRNDLSREPNGTAVFMFGDDESVSGAFYEFCRNPARPMPRFSMTGEIKDIVEGLNDIQPGLLMGYPSAIDVLIAEANAGPLRISPAEVRTCGEYLSETTRDSVRDVWGIEISDFWGAAEGVYAFSCGRDRTMHLPDDLVILEVVDEDAHPVPYGSPGAKVLLTRLYNASQPLIRYEINDVMSMFDSVCECGCAHRRIGDIKGRSDAPFVYPGGQYVHWLGLMKVLTLDPHIVEYQVRQTTAGVSVSIRDDGSANFPNLELQIEAVLAKAGVGAPVVSIARVASVPRLPSGKIHQFVPLALG
jgi:phenylacetate-coenzyme A ligase PaaK-like adenylate-forming protein